MKPFQVLIKPAAGDCNLACEYCFYRDTVSLYPDKRRHRMTRERAEALIRDLLSYRIAGVIIGVILAAFTVLGYQASDNPKFCISCHSMEQDGKRWQISCYESSE